MTFKTKFILTSILFSIIALAAFFFSIESVQKKVFDIKADITGSDRTVTFYAPLTGNKLATYTDKDLRYEVSSNGETISVWLGSVNKKVHSNMGYIIEDNK